MLTIIMMACSLVQMPEDNMMANDGRSISVILANYEKPLVGRSAAANIAQVVAEEYYGPEIFIMAAPATVEDAGEAWRVSLQNGIQLDIFDARRMLFLELLIRKVDGSILEISSTADPRQP